MNNNLIKINEVYQYAWDKGMIKKLVKIRQDLKEILSLKKYKDLKKENPIEYKIFYDDELKYIKNQEKNVRDKINAFYLNTDIIEEMEEEEEVFKVIYTFETVRQFNNINGEFVNVLKDIYLSGDYMFLYIRIVRRLISTGDKIEYVNKRMIKFKKNYKIKNYII